MASKLLDLLSQGHMVYGTVTGGGTASVDCNDGSVTLTDNGTGDYTLTFGDVFLSAPTVVANIVDATDSTDAAHSVAVVSAATNAVQFNTKTTVTNGAATDILSSLADLNFTFMAFGKRNN
jgi:hypothetical protein